MSRCLVCHGSGWAIRYNEKNKQDESEPCECRRERDERDAFRTKLVKACIPPEYWEYTLENYLTLPLGDSIVNKANALSVYELRKYMTDPLLFLNSYNVLWIWGRKPNAGHTSLAVIFAVELLKNKYKVRFMRMQDLVSAFTDFESKKDFFTYLEKFDVYLLDDAFDANRCIVPGDYTNIHLFNWMSAAMSNKKHFICTSKVDIVQISDKFEQSKHLLLKSRLSLEFHGTLKRD